MRSKLTIFFVLIISTILLLAGCGTSNSSDSGSSEDNTFKVGLEAGYAPFNWTQNDDSNGAVKIDGSAEYAGGYDVEIAKK